MCRLARPPTLAEVRAPAPADAAATVAAAAPATRAYSVNGCLCLSVLAHGWFAWADRYLRRKQLGKNVTLQWAAQVHGYQDENKHRSCSLYSARIAAQLLGILHQKLGGDSSEEWCQLIENPYWWMGTLQEYAWSNQRKRCVLDNKNVLGTSICTTSRIVTNFDSLLYLQLIFSNLKRISKAQRNFWTDLSRRIQSTWVPRQAIRRTSRNNQIYNLNDSSEHWSIN